MYHGLPYWNWALQVIAVVTSYYGATLNMRMDVRGFYVWIVSNLCLVTIHLVSHLWILACLDVLYFQINVRSIIRWRRTLLPGQAAGGV